MKKTMKVHDVSRVIRSLGRRAANLERLADGRMGRFYGRDISMASDLKNALQDIAGKQRDIEHALKRTIENLEVTIEL